MTDQLAQITERAKKFLRERGWVGDEVIEDVVEFAATIRAETLEVEKLAEAVVFHFGVMGADMSKEAVSDVLREVIRDAGRKGL